MGTRRVLPVLAAAVVLVAGGLSACGPAPAGPVSSSGAASSSPGSSGATLAGASATASPAPRAAARAPAPGRGSSAGCARQARSGATVITATIGGRRRTARVYVPAGYSGRPRPLLLSLHGSGSTALAQERATGLDDTADGYGFLVAYPQGARSTGAGFSWNVPHTPSYAAHGPDDVAYLAAVVRLLGQRYCVDQGRVYVSGFSGGARMASQLACSQPVRIAGLVAAGGLRAPSPCHVSEPVPVLAFHGTADRTNPYDGHGAPYWTYSVPVAAERWAGYDGCATSPAASTPYPGVTVTSYGGCRGGVAVQLYTLDGVGHRWPPRSGAFQPDDILGRFLSSGGRAAAPGSSAPTPVPAPADEFHR